MRRPTPEQARHAREAKVRKQAGAKTPPTNPASVDVPAAVNPPPRVPYEQYRDGPDGFIRWAEDHINVNITPAGGTMEKWVPLSDLPDTPHPETGRSYRQMWEEQKKVLRHALIMVGGRFQHRLIILCWPRGEGKTYVLCYILLWKFFCWPAQELVLCANSKEQTKFVQYNIIKKIIENSPKLFRMVGRKNIQEKQIRLRDKENKTVSFIKCVSSYTGTLSNITGYSFSEIFQMKDPEFFTQIDGSIRNIVNAFGLIDSTVAAKDHILYHLFEAYKKGEDETLFFDYRYSKTGVHSDYWNPNQTQAQLKSYRIKFVLGSFERYFLNLWSAGAEKVFTPEQVEAVNYLGADGALQNQARVIELLTDRRRQIDEEKRLGPVGDTVHLVQDIDKRLMPVSSIYSLTNASGIPALAPADALDRLGEVFDTDWAILTGMDRADPMKRRSGARTIFVAMAKGLIGSRSNPALAALSEPSVDIDPDGQPVLTSVSFLYLLLRVANVEDHSIDCLKAEITHVHQEFDGIDCFASERWAAWDLGSWMTSELDVPVELIFSSYDRQLAAFTELYTVVKSGRFKSPPTAVRGCKSDELLAEEMLMFDHDIDGKWFGSPEKNLRYGVQDDLMFSLAWTIYGGRALSVKDFRSRGSQPYWGTMIQPRDLVGEW